MTDFTLTYEYLEAYREHWRRIINDHQNWLDVTELKRRQHAALTFAMQDAISKCVAIMNQPLIVLARDIRLQTLNEN